MEAGELAFFYFSIPTASASGGVSAAAARAKNLVRLGVPPALRRYFLERYAAAGGRPLREMFVFWYKLSKGGFSGWIKMKKALRLKNSPAG